MLANYYELGGDSVSAKRVDDLIKQTQEKLIKFFGEKYRNQIIQKISKTKYIFVRKCSLDYDEDVESKYKDPVKSYVEARFGSFEKLNNTYIQGTTITKDNFLSILHNAKDSFKVDDNFLNIILAFNYWLYKQTPTKDLADKIVGDIQNYHLTYIFDMILHDYIAFSNFLNYKFHVYKKTQKALNLTEREEVVFDCLEQVFGDNLTVNLRIAPVYLIYSGLKDKTKLTDEQKHTFENMFNELTGKTLNYNDYIEDESFMNKLSQLDSSIQQKMAEKHLNQAESDNFVRISLPMLKTLTSNYTNGDAVFEEIYNFVKNKFDWIGFQIRLFHNNGLCDSCIILMDESDSHILSHETIHAISSKDDGSSIGFRTDDSNYALNEVITEMFALMADGYSLSTYEGAHLNYYTAAIPILKKFVFKHLKKIKEFYLSSDIQGFQNFIGLENYSDLCNIVSDILERAREKEYTATQIEVFIKKPESCKDKLIMILLNRLKEIVKQINSHIRKEKIVKLFGV